MIYQKKFSPAFVLENKMIFDTHCHLNSEQLYSEIDKYISRAQESNVTKFLVVGYDKKTSLLAVKIAQKYDFCYAAVGFHPTEIFDLKEDDYEWLENIAKEDKVVAIGEIGLDFYWIKEEDKRELQKQSFIRQINLANKLHLPISVHNRDAIEDCLKIIKEYTPKYGGIMHCYSGSVETMKEFIKLGMHISFGGPVTFTNAKTPKEVATVVPLERLLVETDCPYLAPHPLRGTVNEPKNITLVVDEVARLKGMTKEKIESITFSNSCKLLNIK